MLDENLDPPAPESGDPAAEESKGKRPWSKPQLNIVEMLFTQDGFNPLPSNNESWPSVSPPAPSYRTS